MRFLSQFLVAGLLGLVCLPPARSAETTGPAFSSVPQLEQGYHLLYEQRFPEAREVFQKWATENPTEPFGQVSLAASFLFEEFFVQRVLTSDYFLDDKRFLGGITGTPDPGRVKAFEDSVLKARGLAAQRLKAHPRDP